MSSELVPVAEIEGIAKHFVQSGFFKDAAQISQAVVKIMAGREVGLPEFSSMSGVQIIQGKACFGASSLAALVQRSGKYKYRVLHNTADICEIEFFEIENGKWVSVGTSSFTMQDARVSGLLSNQTWHKYPKAMLCARAISGGVRMFCPEITCGPCYVPEELAAPGTVCNEDGTVIESVSYPPPIQRAPVITDDPKREEYRANAPDAPKPAPVAVVQEALDPSKLTKAQVCGLFDNKAAEMGSKVKRSVLLRKLAGPNAVPDAETAFSVLSLPDSTWKRAVDEANWEAGAEQAVDHQQDAPIVETSFADTEPAIDPNADPLPAFFADDSPGVEPFEADPFADPTDASPVDTTAPIKSLGDIMGKLPARPAGPVASEITVSTMTGLAKRAGVELDAPEGGWTEAEAKSVIRKLTETINAANAAAARAKREARG